MKAEYGQCVILELCRSKKSLHRLKIGGSFHDKKIGTVSDADIINLFLGIVYEILPDDKFRVVDDNKLMPNLDLETSDILEVKDNRDIVSNPDNQKLSHEEIESLKAKVGDGEMSVYDLVETIKGNSIFFESKNVFSKNKYINRKIAKFIKTIRVVKPTVMDLIDHYIVKSPKKILYLKKEILSYSLCLLDIRYTSNILVVDHAFGIVIGSLLERITECGSVTSLYEGKKPSHYILECLNTNNPRNLTQMPLGDFLSRDHKHLYDGLIMAGCSETMFDHFTKLSCHINISRCVVIYNLFREMLLPIYTHARESKSFVNILITEVTSTSYQVLPGRTHPAIDVLPVGGHILSMTKVEP